MKIAVFGDVHGNLAAYEAVAEDIDRWRPDVVISTGDIINRGPSPAECLEAVEQRRIVDGWRTLRGNHEDYVIFQTSGQAARTGPQLDSFYQSYWTLTRLGGDVSAVQAWADIAEVEGPAHSLVRVAHASVLGNSVGIFLMNSEAELAERGGSPPPDVFVAGHTHAAFTRRVGSTLFINAGSVGIPFDGDWRAAYARLSHLDGGWQGEIVRLEYDRSRTLAEFRGSGYLSGAGPIAWLVLAEYLYSRSQLFSWQREFSEQVNAGKIDIETTVRAQLERQGMWERVKKIIQN